MGVGGQAKYVQAPRSIGIDTHGALEEDTLLLRGFTGSEGISRLFSFHLDLLSERTSIPFDRIVGKPVTVRLGKPGQEARLIHGYVNGFAQSGNDRTFTHFRAEVVPWLWFLTLHTNSRIFQKKSIPEIIQDVFQEDRYRKVAEYLPMIDFGGYKQREFCVQYQESDFHFVSRLMEQYGIFYFFSHEKGKHTLVLGDAPSVHSSCPKVSQVRYEYVSTGAETSLGDAVTQLDIHQQVGPGKFTVNDYNFKTPKTRLNASAESTVRIAGNEKYEVYEYATDHLDVAEGDELARLRMEEIEARHTELSGSGGCRSFTAGYAFTVVGLRTPYALMCQCCGGNKNTYVLTEVQHSASVGADYAATTSAAEIYSNTFTCIPHSLKYRPPRDHRKVILGPQTALVVGRQGEEIDTDEYGRVKVHFYWDRWDKQDQDSSCWIRVSYPWAGGNWGSVAIPRIGQEVIVEFLEGDPDRPIITGRVYNEDNKPPYDLPANKTQSGTKSRSSKGGKAPNFNEFRLEDKKGSEEVYLHAEKDFNTVVENDDNVKVKRHNTIKVEEGHQTITIEMGNHTMDVDQGHHTLRVKQGNQELDVSMGHATLNVNMGNRDVSVPVGTYQLKANQVKVTATTDLTLQCGAGKININVAGIITIQGTLVKIN